MLRQAPYEPVHVNRDARGRILPGQPSINPHGRPLGFVEYIRHMTGDGQELVDHALLCLRGSVLVEWMDEDGITRSRTMPADPKYQAEARAWLAERGYGKAIQTIEMATADDGDGVDYSKLTVDESRELLRLMAKASTGSTGLAPALEAGALHSTRPASAAVVSPAFPRDDGPSADNLPE